jgi:hypothetical protein
LTRQSFCTWGYALASDQGRYLGYVRAIARRRGDATPDEPITAIPVTYAKHPLYRA